MKNNILKIINEKYEKYSIGYSRIKCPKFEHFGMMRHSFFGRCPIFFFGQNRSSPPPKNGPYAYAYIAHNIAAKTSRHRQGAKLRHCHPTYGADSMLEIQLRH